MCHSCVLGQEEALAPDASSEGKSHLRAAVEREADGAIHVLLLRLP